MGRTVEMNTVHVRRYHPLLVLLHWAVALLTMAALVFGAIKLVPIPNSDPYKINGLRVHMIVGMLILALVLVRLLVREVTTHPPKAPTGNAFLDRVERISHRLLYAALIGQAVM
jgi:cytochrome b561